MEEQGRTNADEIGPLRPSLLASMLDLHARPLKPGFWQLSVGGVSVNLDDDMMARYRASGSARFDAAEGRCVFDTGYPRLDLVLAKLYEECGLPPNVDRFWRCPNPCCRIVAPI